MRRSMVRTSQKRGSSRVIVMRACLAAGRPAVKRALDADRAARSDALRRMRWLCLLLIGCASADPCEPFPNESCVTLEVRGAPEVSQLDQLALAASFLGDGRTPSQPRAFTLPVRVAVLPGAAFTGPFSLDVRGLRDQSELGRD